MTSSTREARLRARRSRSRDIAQTAGVAVSGEMYKTAGKWYNLVVQVAAGQIIKYTAELRRRCESRYLSAGGVSFGVAV